MKNPIPWAQNAAWASLGIAAGAIVAWLGWSPVYAALSDEGRAEFVWQGPLLFIAAIAFGLFSIVCFLMNRSVQKELERDAQRIVEDMDDIYKPYLAPSPEMDQPSNSEVISSQVQM